MKKFYILSVLLVALQMGFTHPISQEEEALFLRRISEFWQEGEISLAKMEMEKFLKIFPDSAYADPLIATLGDLQLKENNYSEALVYYDQLKDPKYLHSVLLNRLHALFHLGAYEKLIEECKPLEEGENGNALHYFLAVCLYKLALKADPPSEELLQKAEPHFEKALEQEDSQELRLALAHLYSILHEEEKAADIYLSLKTQESLNPEEMEFQAALCQAKFDKALALEAFEKLSSRESERGQNAFFNWLILSFELEHFQEIVEQKSRIVTGASPALLSKSHLILAKSLVKLGEVEEALEELAVFLREKPDGVIYKEALLTLLDAAYQKEHLGYFEEALEKMQNAFPEDPEIPKALFSKAQLIKKRGETEEALASLKQLVEKHKDFPQKAQALFEVAHLEHQRENWEAVKEYASLFLEEFSEHELSSFVWRYLASSLIKGKSPELKKVELLEKLTEKEELFSSKELLQCRFYLAKVQFELGFYEKSIQELKALLANPAFEEKANGKLLLSLCHRDGRRDDLTFVQEAEEALLDNPDLMDLGSLHASLFNAYMKLEEMHPEFLMKKEEHLFKAFEKDYKMEEKNFFWLVDTFFSQMGENPSSKEKVVCLLEKKIGSLDFTKAEEVLHLETPICKLAKAYRALQEEEKAVALLQELHKLQEEHKELDWKEKAETAFLLAEVSLSLHAPLEAEKFFEEVNRENAILQNPLSAFSLLESARLKIERYKKEELSREDPQWGTLLSSLKSLILQKSLKTEPIHLEAALEYVELQSFLHGNKAKRLELLEKMKNTFEEKDSLLGKDYHDARERFPEKDLLYRQYLHFFDAEILLSKALIEEAKDLLVELTDEKTDSKLRERAMKRLEILR